MNDSLLFVVLAGGCFIGLQTFWQARCGPKRFSAIYHQASVGFFQCDAEGRLVHLNPKACEILGYTLQELKGKAMPDITYAEDVAADTRRIRRLIAGEIPHLKRYKRYQRSDGSIVWALASLSVIRHPGEGPRHYFGVIEEMPDGSMESPHFMPRQHQFLAHLSHELRTPLQGILGFSTLLEQTLPAGENRFQARLIREETERLDRLLGDALDVSHIESEEFRLHPLPFHLNEVVETCHHVYALQAHQRGLSFKVVRGIEGLPEVLGDSGRLSQILHNLLSNAIKYTDSGQVSLQVRRLAPDGNGVEQVLLQVSDTGIGIPPERQGDLFKRFSRITNGLPQQRSGTGLGLAIVQGLVRSMGGTLELHSVPGEGTTVRVVLPFTTVSYPEALPCLPPGLPQTRPLRVLVADDEPVNRVLMCKLLQRRGHDVAEAVDGENTCALAATRPFDLIFLDLRMPGRDGCQSAAHIRATPGPNRSIPIIAMTGCVFDSDQRQAMACGMNGLLTKPVRLETLHQLLVEYEQPEGLGPRQHHGEIHDHTHRS